MLKELAFAILELSSLPNGYPVQSFRVHPLGAVGRAEQLAAYFADAAKATGIDPFLLTALGYAETRFDGARIGGVGERGIMQLHPRYTLGKRYAAESRGLPQDQKDRLSIFLGADALRHGLKVCGRRAHAIGFYRSGRCVAGPGARNVYAIKRRLLRAAGAV